VNQDVSPEDRTILTALASLERRSGDPLVPDDPSDHSDPSDTAEMLARLYTEVLGLLPYELEPVAPTPAGRARVLAAVAGVAALHGEPYEPAPAALLEDETQEIDPLPAPRPEPVAQPSALAPERPELRPEPRPEPRRERPTTRVAMVAAPPRRSWPLALAASLVLALGGFSGWLVQQRAEQEVTIETLRSELAGERRKTDQAVAEVRRQMERMQTNFALVTAPAVTVSPLHPVGKPSQARGMLFVAPDHQHWYMAVHDLPPAEPGRDYQLWWIADGGTVSGGTFDTRPGEKMELSSESMPANTRDVVITLEAEGGAPKPSGPEILRAAGVYDIS
jgi:uncharacterized coiled-coil protein SlyX